MSITHPEQISFIPTGGTSKSLADELDALGTFTASGTGAVARTIASRLSDVVSVKDFGAVGDNATDNTAAFNAANAASLNLYVPPGQYLLDKFTPKTGTRLIGAGWYSTTLRPANTANSVIFLDRDAGTTTGYGIEIGNLRIKGFDTGAGHGIESTAPNSGAAGLHVHDVWIEHFNAAAVYLAGVWASRLHRVWVDWQGAGGHAFHILYAFTGTTLSECYAKALTPGSGKCGFRIEQGMATLIDCNGTDLGDEWGIFGSATASGDAQNAAVRVSIIGCNIEDFGQTGIEFRQNTQFTLDGSHFYAPISIATTGSITTGTPTLTVASATGLFAGQFLTIAGITGSVQIASIAGTTVTLTANVGATVAGATVANAVRAIYVTNTNVKPGNIYTASNLVESKGAAWKNGQPAHCSFPPGFLKFTDNDFQSFYYETGGFNVAIPELIPAQAATSCMRARGGFVIDDGVALGAFIRNHFSASFAGYGGATIGANASAAQSVTVTGAARGHTALVGYDGGADNALPAGIFMTAIVVAANTVRVMVTNTTAGSVTVPAGTLRVDTWSHF